MPPFPTYHGPPLPETLSPLKPGHYWLLFKWIFFQPSRLLHYLYNADPELSQAARRQGDLRVPGGRQLIATSFS